MYYASYERDLILRARSLFEMRFSWIIDGVLDEKQNYLAAVCFYVQSQAMLPDHKKDSSLMSYRILAAKLRAEQTAPIPFVLMPDYVSLTQVKPVNRLWERYMSNSSGPGYWSNSRHESVFCALFYRLNSACPVFVLKDNLLSLRAAYFAQEQEALKIKEAPQKKLQKMTESKVDDPPKFSDILLASIEDRKQGATFGSCYRCSAVKPKSLPCTVCGHTPRQGGYR